MAIEVLDATERNRFEVVVDGVVGGFAEYERDDDRIVFTHTEVADEFEGQGIGSTLVRGALDTARGYDIDVVVRCPFITRFIEQHPEYEDLLERD